MPSSRLFFVRPDSAGRRRENGGALIETIISMTIVALFLSGLHLTNSQVVSHTRGSLESCAALRVLNGRSEWIRASTWSQITDPAFLHDTLLAVDPDSCAELGNLVETIQIAPHGSATAGSPIQIQRANGSVSILSSGDGSLPLQDAVRVDISAAWTGKGNHSRMRQASIIISQGGLIGRN